MKFIEYLDKRNKRARSLTLAEAKVMNINYPLPKGWVKLYGDIELSHEVLKKLVDAKANRYGQKSYKKSKAKSKRKGMINKRNNEVIEKMTSNDIKLLEDALKKLKSARYRANNGIANKQDDYKVNPIVNNEQDHGT